MHNFELGHWLITIKVNLRKKDQEEIEGRKKAYSFSVTITILPNTLILYLNISFFD